ncbi:hypothetical protein [Salinivibrio phage CW02]|uniref:Uncharacterized protein n=1 Tax=Salinivibrio phage CW02 TaxID=1161935 RepID=H9D1D5_9CAUD|nr:hypothetical protein F490_gp60 [Salinivibrio phage CW02]AFE86177.1 hypothetical protein [Salinivibrio phage CW02]
MTHLREGGKYLLNLDRSEPEWEGLAHLDGTVVEVKVVRTSRSGVVSAELKQDASVQALERELKPIILEDNV